MAPNKPVQAVTVIGLIFFDSFQLITTYIDHIAPQIITKISPKLILKESRAFMEPLHTIKIAPIQQRAMPSQPNLLNFSPIKIKAKVEVTAGPILSIKAAFEAGIERSASKNKKLCRYIPTQPIIIRILRSRQGTIIAFLPLAKYKKENKIAATK